MHIKKTLLVVGAVTSVGLAGLATVNSVSAATDSNGQSLAYEIAQKFNLNEDEVQAVFDEEQATREAEHKAEMSERLQEAVDSGDITSDQKALIENKQAELQKVRESERDALEAWASEQGIDAKYLMGGGMHGPGAPGAEQRT